MKTIHADKDELNFPPSKEVLEALKTMNIDDIRLYQKEPELLSVLAKKHDIPKDRVFLEAGIIGIIHRVFDGLESPTILVPELGYPYYQSRFPESTLKFDFKKENDEFSYDLEDLIKKLQTKPSIAVLIDPESPLGFSIPENDLIKVLDAADNNTLVFLDQEHEGFRENNIRNITQLVNEYPNLLVARSFSKFFGLAGVRIAYALCGENVKNMINFREKYLGFDCFAQKLAKAALESEEHYKENTKKIRELKKRFSDAVKNRYKVYETDSQSVVVEVPEYVNETLQNNAVKAGILIRHLGDYHTKLRSMYKVTMCPETDRIIDLFESVAWLSDLSIENSEAKSVVNTRKAGYTVHRKEIPCEKSKLMMGMHRVIIPPGKHVPAHSHPEQDELFGFHSEAYFELNGRKIKVKPGDWINVKPCDTHYIEALEDRFARFECFRFPYKKEKPQGSYNPSE